ncbi:zinc knuckle CX2CX4HX4C containing protein [Tanacetum coccineum]
MEPIGSVDSSNDGTDEPSSSHTSTYANIVHSDRVKNKGLEDVLENGPYMISNVPIILKKWSQNVSLAKEDLMKVPVWVKLHNVPIVAFTSDELSMIATKLDNPIMLDSYTSSMCMKSWGCGSFNRAFFELDATCGLKDMLVVVILKFEGSCYTMKTIRVTKAEKQKDVQDVGLQSVKWKTSNEENPLPKKRQANVVIGKAKMVKEADNGNVPGEHG